MKTRLRDRFFDVVVPLLPKEIQEQNQKQSKTIHPLNSARQWSEISEVMQDSYNQMSQSQKERLFDKIREALD